MSNGHIKRLSDGMTRSDFEIRFWDPDVLGARWREHRYVGGPPPPRIKRMQLAHETRARKAGVDWDMVDLRTVYRHHSGICGICREPVSIDEFTIDHIVPIVNGGPHVFSNLQLAHGLCNSRKGDG